MTKKKKPAKKPRPMPAKLRAVRKAIDATLGTGGAKATTYAKDDPRHARHFTICVYARNAPPGDMPVDVIPWDAATVKYGITQKAALQIKPALLGGQSVTYASSLTKDPLTFFAVLETGRAADDIRRAFLITQKAQGVLN